VSKRNYIEEILAKRERLISGQTRLSHFAQRTLSLDDGFVFISEQPGTESFRDEFVKYLPIGYVAAMEAYFRIIFRDLIDFGPPFSENLKSFGDIKFQIEPVLAIASKAISVGEFVAHLLPFNNLKDINENMSRLIGEDFLNRLEKTKITTLIGAKPVPMENYHSKIPFSIKRLFEMRHTFCHEFAINENANLQEIRDCCFATLFFVLATESLANELKVFSAERIQ
jgi:hypothetical protein